MKKYASIGMFILGTSFIFLISCAAPPSTSAPSIASMPSVQSPSIQENLGEQVARHLNERYKDTRANCGSPSQPSFLCNGILLRGTGRGDFPVWNNSQNSKNRGSVSFSYLRKDDNFQRLAYGYSSGFIFQSYNHVPAKLHPEVLCSFPIDGWTNERATSGCGAYSGRPSSGPCHLSGVVTAAQWWTHYSAAIGNKNTGQCGFDVRDSRNALAGPAFAASVQARTYFKGSAAAAEHNEVAIKVWADNLGRTLPLEAFFYIYGSDGRANAQTQQRKLKAADGLLIPIISIRLARSDSDTATFYFLPADQTEPMPPARF